MTTEPDIEKLREEIARATKDLTSRCAGYKPVDHMTALGFADTILAIPAIADRLSVAPLSSPGDVSA